MVDLIACLKKGFSFFIIIIILMLIMFDFNPIVKFYCLKFFHKHKNNSQKLERNSQK